MITNTVNENEFQVKLLSEVLSKENFERDVELWNEFYKNKSVVNLKFVNIKDKSDILYVPNIIHAYYYGSNGMSAGNTKDEALVQGLSEIFERFAVRKMLKEGIVPPDITSLVKERYPFLENLINNIESFGSKIYVKDMSMGIGLPVVAILYVNLNSSSYVVNFGSHPVNYRKKLKVT